MDSIREIERIIDNYHKTHKVMEGSKRQAIFDLMVAFGDLCINTCLVIALNPSASQKIVDNMDALNQALMWIEGGDLSDNGTEINCDITEQRYNECIDFLQNYAYPYSVICSGYISYSRNRFVSRVSDQTVVFDLPDNCYDFAWEDILRERQDNDLEKLICNISPVKVSAIFNKLKASISLENEELCYSLNGELLQSYLEIARNQWDITKTLPEGWKFDYFTLDEYRQTWIAIAALCYIHLSCLFTIENQRVRIKNSVIRQNKDDLVRYVSDVSGIKEDTIVRIIDYITFEPSKKNIDIAYQPIVNLNNHMMIIAPMLFIASRPERNLLSLVCLNNSDREHSQEVNRLEDIMADDIVKTIAKESNIDVKRHKQLGGALPDIDLAIFDRQNNAILLCELKWFIAADSSKEVYAREDDITHGCEQQEKIMEYALRDRNKFLKQVFSITTEELIDIFCCVVTKNNIRTMNKHVPVIDIKTLKTLLERKPLISAFDSIRNHEYGEKMRDNILVTHKSIQYAGYEFRIPALCIGSWKEET